MNRKRRDELLPPTPCCRQRLLALDDRHSHPLLPAAVQEKSVALLAELFRFVALKNKKGEGRTHD